MRQKPSQGIDLLQQQYK